MKSCGETLLKLQRCYIQTENPQRHPNLALTSIEYISSGCSPPTRLFSGTWKARQRLRYRIYVICGKTERVKRKVALKPLDNTR